MKVWILMEMGKNMKKMYFIYNAKYDTGIKFYF